MHINLSFLNSNFSGTVSGSYINFLADANMGFTSGAYEFKNIGTVGVGIRFVSYGKFEQFDENRKRFGYF